MKKSINQLFARILRTQLTGLSDEIAQLNEKQTNQLSDMEHLKQRESANEHDYHTFYKLLLCRNPEEGLVMDPNISKWDLFSNIVRSEEFELRQPYDCNASCEEPSYAQAGEDRILRYIFGMTGRLLQEVTYLDLGANRVKNLSNTYIFYENGAKGVLVDANPMLCELLIAERARDTTLNKCISEKSGEIVRFYILNNDGLSSPDKNVIDTAMIEDDTLKIVKTIDVETISVNDILRQYFSSAAPTILNVDIEGNELGILSSIDFDTMRPFTIICEMIPYSPKLVVAQKNKEIMNFMESKDYVEYAFTGINSIFIDKRQL